jgi:hypothetical protein
LEAFDFTPLYEAFGVDGALWMVLTCMAVCASARPVGGYVVVEFHIGHFDDDETNGAPLVGGYSLALDCLMHWAHNFQRQPVFTHCNQFLSDATCPGRRIDTSTTPVFGYAEKGRVRPGIERASKRSRPAVQGQPGRPGAAIDPPGQLCRQATGPRLPRPPPPPPVSHCPPPRFQKPKTGKGMSPHTSEARTETQADFVGIILRRCTLCIHKRIDLAKTQGRKYGLDAGFIRT